jgi:hypothetical protein
MNGEYCFRMHGPLSSPMVYHYFPTGILSSEVHLPMESHYLPPGIPSPPNGIPFFPHWNPVISHWNPIYLPNGISLSFQWNLIIFPMEFISRFSNYRVKYKSYVSTKIKLARINALNNFFAKYIQILL